MDTSDRSSAGLWLAAAVLLALALFCCLSSKEQASRSAAVLTTAGDALALLTLF